MSKPAGMSWLTYARFGVIKYIRRLFSAVNKIRLQREPVWSEIKRFKREVKRYPQFTKSYRHYSKYFVLYQSIRNFRPKCVLELGSGISTAIIVAALKENGSGQLVSMDELGRYGEPVRQIVGDAVEMHISPSIESVYDGIHGRRYQSIPDRSYDFIFVDGPQTDSVDLDVFPFLEKNPRIRVLVDCRRMTFRELQKRYGGRFNDFLNLGMINYQAVTTKP